MKTTIFTQDVVPQAPDDPHYGLRAAFRADTSDQKVDLIIGVYRDDDGKPWNLPVVVKVTSITTPILRCRTHVTYLT